MPAYGEMRCCSHVLSTLDGEGYDIGIKVAGLDFVELDIITIVALSLRFCSSHS
jgi:hypothetical protein